MTKKGKAPKKGKNLAGGKTLGKQKTTVAAGGDFNFTHPIDKPTP